MFIALLLQPEDRYERENEVIPTNCIKRRFIVYSEKFGAFLTIDCFMNASAVGVVAVVIDRAPCCPQTISAAGALHHLQQMPFGHILMLDVTVVILTCGELRTVWSKLLVKQKDAAVADCGGCKTINS
jgi:hypothetical protein